MVDPLILFSQIRSGSTLAQRVLGAHPSIATASEPWLLLPLLYTLKPVGARADYWHLPAHQAIGDLISELPGGESDYLESMRAFAISVYSKATPGDEAYFLDKTPHYHFVASELLDLFPDGKFVFLWRHPLAVVTSILETFRGGRFEPFLFKQDIFDAPKRLSAARSAAGTRACDLFYERAVGGEEEAWRPVFDYLDLTWEPSVLRRFKNVELSGQYGDPTGSQRYRTLSSEPLTKWHKYFRGPVRRAWARRYLRWLGADTLAVMGFSLDDCLAELDDLPRGSISGAPIDLVRLANSAVDHKLRVSSLLVRDARAPVLSPSE